MGKSKKNEQSTPAQQTGSPVLPDKHITESEASLFETRLNELVGLHYKYTQLYTKHRRPAPGWSPFDDLTVHNEVDYQVHRVREAIGDNIRQGKEGNVDIDIHCMQQDWKGYSIPLPSIILIYRYVGCETDYFRYLTEDDQIWVNVVAGGDSDEPQAFVISDPGKGMYCGEYYTELESFSVLSVLKRDKHGEVGIVTVFEKEAGFIQTKIVTGNPTLIFHEVSLTFSDSVDSLVNSIKQQLPPPASIKNTDPDEEFVGSDETAPSLINGDGAESDDTQSTPHPASDEDAAPGDELTSSGEIEFSTAVETELNLTNGEDTEDSVD